MSTENTLSQKTGNVRRASAGRMVQILGRRLNATMTQELAHMGLKLDHFALLMTLSEAENLSQTELACATGQAGYSVTRALDALSDLGLVERRDDAHSRRTHRIFLTPKGRDTMPRIFAIINKVNGDLFAALTDQEATDFTRILQKLVK